MIHLSLFVAALAAALPAVAQKPAPLDPAALAAARSLIANMHFDQTMRQGMAAPLADMRTGKMMDSQFAANPEFAAARTRDPAKWAEAMRKLGTLQANATEQAMHDMQPGIIDHAAEIYTANFTVDEIRGLAAFYNTPLGQKVIARLPAVMSDTMLYVQREIPQRIQPKIEAMKPQMTAILTPLLASPGK